jgi:hypothetical protein
LVHNTFEIPATKYWITAFPNSKLHTSHYSTHTDTPSDVFLYPHATHCAGNCSGTTLDVRLNKDGLPSSNLGQVNNCSKTVRHFIQSSQENTEIMRSNRPRPPPSKHYVQFMQGSTIHSSPYNQYRWHSIVKCLIISQSRACTEGGFHDFPQSMSRQKRLCHHAFSPPRTGDVGAAARNHDALLNVQLCKYRGWQNVLLVILHVSWTYFKMFI